MRQLCGRETVLLQSCPTIGSGFKKRLQNQHRCYLVDDSLPTDRRMTCIVQMPVRLGRRQPLIPKMHCDAELHPQFLGKRLRLRRLRTLITRHVQGIAHHRLFYAVLAQNPGH